MVLHRYISRIFWIGVLVSIARESLATPELHAEKVLHLNENKNEHLATVHQAMNVWYVSDAVKNPEQKEYVVAQTHVFNVAARRADDEEWVVMWEWNEGAKQLQERHRRKLSCPNVYLSVPNRGPYIYEARLSMDWRYYVLHPECSCLPSNFNKCPRGVHVSVKPSLHLPSTWKVLSPGRTHYMHIENEYGQQIADTASHWNMGRDVIAPIHVVKEALLADVTSGEFEYGCPGSRDDTLGRDSVTFAMLWEANKVRAPSPIEASKVKTPSPVEGRWCLVKRGHCEITAKVKACIVAGAVGVIVVDHGNFAVDNEDQEATIRIVSASGERPEMIKPVIFVSQSEGTRIMNAAADPSNTVTLGAGPSFEGPPPEGYKPATGLVVYDIAAGPDGPSKSYPDLFGHVGWLEVSDVRDILFVCLPDKDMIAFFDVRKPMEHTDILSGIQVPCSRSGTHDYHVVEYVHDSRYYTVLIDPTDRGNKLYYFETTDPRNPKFIQTLHASWEHEADGLGQVRAGGPNGRYQIITWHCSNLYCGKNHGDSLYVLDSHDLNGGARKIPLPLSKGAMARDIACNNHGICLATLTWDGAVAVDIGVKDTVNQFRLVASKVEATPFSGADIPYQHAWLRMHSGAQKVYASGKHMSSFYVEHANFSMGPLRLGNAIEAVKLNEIWRVTLYNYVPTIEVEEVTVTGATGVESNDEIENDDKSAITLAAIVAGVGILSCLSLAAGCLLIRAKQTIRKQRAELETHKVMVRPMAETTTANVVVGRPIEQSPHDGAIHGEPLGGRSAKGPDVMHAARGLDPPRMLN